MARDIGAVVKYVLPADAIGPVMVTKFIEAAGHETVAAFYDRCKAKAAAGYLVSIELKEIE